MTSTSTREVQRTLHKAIPEIMVREYAAIKRVQQCRRWVHLLLRLAGSRGTRAARQELENVVLSAYAVYNARYGDLELSIDSSIQELVKLLEERLGIIDKDARLYFACELANAMPSDLPYFLLQTTKESKCSNDT